MIDISKNTGFFHDGNLLDIRHERDMLEFVIESSQIDPTEFDNNELLSQTNTLKGVLRLTGIKAIEIDNVPYNGILQILYDDAEILDLEITSNTVVFIVQWKNFPPKQRFIDTSKIEIEAEHIQWITDTTEA